MAPVDDRDHTRQEAPAGWALRTNFTARELSFFAVAMSPFSLASRAWIKSFGPAAQHTHSATSG